MKNMKRNIVTRLVIWMMVAMLSAGAIATVDTTDVKAAATVLITRTGSKYHKRKCGRGTFFKVSLTKAKARHLSPCKKCFHGKAPSSSKKTSKKKTTKKTTKKAAAKTFNFSLNKTKIVIKKGETKKLKVVGTKRKAKWSTKKKSIATVSSKGVVKGKKKGTTVIKAKISGKVRKCKVIVK